MLFERSTRYQAELALLQHKLAAVQEQVRKLGADLKAYRAKMNAAYSMTDADDVVFETGEIVRAPKETPKP